MKHPIGPARLRAPRVFARARDKAPARRPGKTFISWTSVAMMTVGAVGYLGSAPALSVLGLASVFLYVLPAIVFLLPASLVSAEVASGWQGGVYNWVREAISAPMGMLAVWCQFAQTIFYYPALLAYVAGTLAYTKIGVPAERAAKVIARAATASRPRARYTVGRDAAILVPLARVVSDRFLDRMLRLGLRPHYVKNSQPGVRASISIGAVRRDQS
jgi:Amino acid permease